jgi:hypothetical protein
MSLAKKLAAPFAGKSERGAAIDARLHGDDELRDRAVGPSRSRGFGELDLRVPVSDEARADHDEIAGTGLSKADGGNEGGGSGGEKVAIALMEHLHSAKRR